MDQTINIADLVKTKFQPKQEVWVVQRGYRGIENIRPTRIKSIAFQIVIGEDGKRAQQTTYICLSDRTYGENELIASLDDIPADQRKPILG